MFFTVHVAAQTNTITTMAQCVFMDLGMVRAVRPLLSVCPPQPYLCALFHIRVQPTLFVDATASLNTTIHTQKHVFL
jgi:hypothetical protein